MSHYHPVVLFIRFASPNHPLASATNATAKLLVAQATGVAHDHKSATVTQAGAVAIKASPAIEEAIAEALRNAERVAVERDVPGDPEQSPPCQAVQQLPRLLAYAGEFAA
jgi:hypothetical protein